MVGIVAGALDACYPGTSHFDAGRALVELASTPEGLNAFVAEWEAAEMNVAILLMTRAGTLHLRRNP